MNTTGKDGISVIGADIALDDHLILKLSDGNEIDAGELPKLGNIQSILTQGGGGSVTAASLGLGTSDSPQFAGVNIGHATDTTLTRVSAGVVAVEGSNIMLVGSADTVTGAKTFNNVLVTQTAPAISSGTITYALGGSNVFSVALNANITTSTVTGIGASGTTSSWQVLFTADGTARTIVHPSGIVWAGGTAPTMTSTNGKRDWIMYLTFNGGTTVFGFVLGQNF